MSMFIRDVRSLWHWQSRENMAEIRGIMRLVVVDGMATIDFKPLPLAGHGLDPPHSRTTLPTTKELQ